MVVAFSVNFPPFIILRIRHTTGGSSPCAVYSWSHGNHAMVCQVIANSNWKRIVERYLLSCIATLYSANLVTARWLQCWMSTTKIIFLNNRFNGYYNDAARALNIPMLWKDGRLFYLIGDRILVVYKLLVCGHLGERTPLEIFLHLLNEPSFSAHRKL